MNRTLFSGLIILTLIAVIVAVTLSMYTSRNWQSRSTTSTGSA